MNHLVGIILTSVDDASIAKTLARGLIEQQLAACVQISAAGTSIYHWDGKLQESSEYYLSIKAPLSRRNEIISWLQQHHPYDTPEIIALEAQAAKAYADWVEKTASVSNP
ncbi:MAG: hypothetical protein COW19_01135 [Zetaproteobacteria bacterium CG12_big_fil_rev_8_21_14_0_65_55_1124]|nr:MAG: hypothetical protein AUJ58_08725 [Zetaproteobacteria bacterium CG1_02_55_237]PIS20475.1 MAG: hypothetical protein COT53_00180 [Zetaproteobacteria bacterium CG08_land_8_20_14_0_20_55_17]PIW43754.1 MAG: hypothetical protein COW19_01135 [Zetaproteobacteria bacterium CG12_big_fil_rev_8_21_14_0_65_55_1124]PIY53289.1 MAG: hypothetical protein COZ01_04335 [Zetaproteobacteria bacterium CG_4_10_14_0_8_um_filter_55_43]PIZ40138.1 MAG: hypothetical protein COY36_00640 [Zetaproteobacteria bacterium 